MSSPDSADLVTAASRVSTRAAAITAKDQSTYDSDLATAQTSAQEDHFWRAICAWCNQTDDGDTLRETSKTFMCENTALVSAGWLTSAESALTAKGFVVTRDAGTCKFTVSQV